MLIEAVDKYLSVRRSVGFKLERRNATCGVSLVSRTAAATRMWYPRARSPGRLRDCPKHSATRG